MRILVATDGSAPAHDAVELVRRAPWPEGSAVQVVEAIDPGAGVLGGPWPTLALVQIESVESDVLAHAEETVRDAAAEIAEGGLAVESAVARGPVAPTLVDRAKRFGADLVVVGSRGHGTIESMVLGSVSAEVIDRAHGPVLVARGTRVERVLLAWDGSSCASRAAAILTHWPVFGRSCVRVVSVADVGVPWWSGFPPRESLAPKPAYLRAAEAGRARHAELARTMAEELRAVGLEAEPDVREGDAAAELIAAARDWPADLVVMGTHGRRALARMVLGSVARNVVQHAPCSVLVVRDPSFAEAPAA